MVEVLASIMILSLAIIPMVAMFDLGLNAATTSGNYDRARALANKKLEQAKSLSYDQVKSNFPVAGATMVSGVYNSPTPINNTVQSDVPAGYSYTVRKRFVEARLPAGSTNQMNFVAVSSDTGVTSPNLGGMIEVRVTVTWGGNKSYSTIGIVAKSQ
jgi:hypothetical protein